MAQSEFTRERISKILADCLKEVAGIDYASIPADKPVLAYCQSEHGFDSLDLVEAVMYVEEYLGTDISDEELDQSKDYNKEQLEIALVGRFSD